MICRAIAHACLGLGLLGCAPAPIVTRAVETRQPAPPTRTPTPTYSAVCANLPPAGYGGTPIPLPTLPVPPATPGLVGRSQLVETKFYSESLGKTMPLFVYLPPGYFDVARRYPVLYMLGGYNGDYREWMQWGMCRALEQLIRTERIPPMIVVTPEGERSWWFNHADAPGSDGKLYGDYIWKDLVGYVDANYRTLPRRESRAIGGLSAGGQGALMFGLTHPEVFSIVGAHSPSLRGADGSLAFFGTPDYFRQYDPIWLFEHTQTWRQLTIWVDVAAQDRQWGEAALGLHQLLDRLGVPHEFSNTVPGVHDNLYWSARLADYLDWYARQLQDEP